MSEKYETPKRLTAHNDVTGALIKSKTNNQDAYAEGWDRIFGKKKKPEMQEAPNDHWYVSCTPDDCMGCATRGDSNE